MLEKYAELIVKQGVNVQIGQELVVEASIESYKLVREVTKQAYLVGAKDVIVHYYDDEIAKMRYQNCELEHFYFVPKYIAERKNEYASRHIAFLSIDSSDPEAMKDIDPKKISTWRSSVRKACKEFHDTLDMGINRWCIVAAPSLKWANRVFSDVDDKEAVEMLWNAIYKVTRCDQDDPIAAWDQHHQSFEKRVKYLNEHRIDTLHITNSLGTNLTIGLTEDYLFAGGASYTTDGIRNFANIPTEEIFTTPHRFKVDGIVYSSLPLNYNGSLIDDFSITFKNGKIIDFTAKKGYEALQSIIDTDEGSHYLGELALVPYDSPIQNMKVLFYNTLFDENAACHLAIGKGFAECIEEGLSSTKEEMLEKGVNDSLTHIDFMFGTSDLSIVATLKDGSTLPIFKDGNFVF